MCAENTARQAAPADHGREEKRSAASRVASLPLVSSACAAAAAAYARAEQRHPYVGALCAAAAKGARTLTAAAATGARPVLAKLEPRIATANRFACKGLDKLEEKLPILQQPSEKVVAETRMLVSSAVTGAREAASGVVGTARGAVQGGVERTRAALSAGVGTVVGSPVGRMVVTGVETVLGKSEELLDRYLPMTDEELAKLTAAVQGFETAPAERRQSYAARLGSLSAKLQHRALQHSLGGLRSARRSLARLQHIRQLVRRRPAPRRAPLTPGVLPFPPFLPPPSFPGRTREAGHGGEAAGCPPVPAPLVAAAGPERGRGGRAGSAGRQPATAKRLGRRRFPARCLAGGGGRAAVARALAAGGLRPGHGGPRAGGAGHRLPHPLLPRPVGPGGGAEPPADDAGPGDHRRAARLRGAARAPALARGSLRPRPRRVPRGQPRGHGQVGRLPGHRWQPPGARLAASLQRALSDGGRPGARPLPGCGDELPKRPLGTAKLVPAARWTLGAGAGSLRAWRLARGRR
ncbi:perilipin-5-like isoform X1 [Struthio camelus]|uniref:perilipin-5-like isoform X1 n=1 Tax=Struthio camelus TaxID=8801 RepID=UPI003603CDB4